MILTLREKDVNCWHIQFACKLVEVWHNSDGAFTAKGAWKFASGRVSHGSLSHESSRMIVTTCFRQQAAAGKAAFIQG